MLTVAATRDPGFRAVRLRRALRLLVAVCVALPIGAAGAAAAGPTAVPTFGSLGLYWSPADGSASKAVTVRYRGLGSSTWRTGPPLWYSTADAEYRGSLVMLTSGSTYEIELTVEGGSQATLQATTWSETFPIGETVTLPTTSSSTLVITRGGSPGGYVLYTHAPGGTATIDVADQQDYDVDVRASYVIVRGLTLKGARHHGIHLPSSGTYTDVVLEENDISGWGAPDGVFGAGYEAGIRADNNLGVKRLIVQRNRIHHPRYDTNSWCENRDGTPDANCGVHPVGPVPIRLTGTGGNHVIRYNEIDSDDAHYFYDGIGGQGGTTGFPGRDSDIHGNSVSRCWDNPIEAEGTDINVRIWGNYFDRSYAHIAFAPATGGPMYVWRNVINAARKGPFSDANDQHGKFVKTGAGGSGRVYVYHNTVLQPPSTLHGVNEGIANNSDGIASSQIVSRNNIIVVVTSSDSSIQESGTTSNDYDYDLYNGKIPAGKEPHGIRGVPVYDPGNAADEHFLHPSSPGFDRGVLLPGFNDDYVGAGPDVGAYEAGRPKLEFGVDAYRSGSIAAPANVRRTDRR